MSTQLIRISFLGLLLILIEGCESGSDAVIEGTVYDNFNQPLEIASAEIIDSGFKTKVGSDGVFQLDYAPGNLEVKISAPGYSSRLVKLELSQASKYPLDDTVLTKIPEAKGVYLIGVSDYVSLAPSKINRFKISGGMAPTYSYQIQSTNDWLPFENSLIEEVAKLVAASESNELAFFDSTAKTHMPLVLEGNSLGHGSGDPFKGKGFKSISEEITSNEGFVIRKLKFPVSQLGGGDMFCFAPMGENVLGVQMIISDQQAHCISGNKNGFNKIRMLDPVPEEYAQLSIDALQEDSSAMEVAAFKYEINCKFCHEEQGSQNGGGVNLSDGLPLTGGDVEKITNMMQNGLTLSMPSMGGAIGSKQGMLETAHYVLSLSGSDHDSKMAEAGQKYYSTMCMACHGREGTGNFSLYAPDLTDESWIYENSASEIAGIIEKGSHRAKPTCRQMGLSDAACKLLIAYAQRFSEQ